MRTPLSLILFAAALGGCTTLPQPSAEPSAAFVTGAVGAADPRAAEAGEEILRAGGSAVDAAIATMLALNVVEPQSSGIGGGGFLVRGAADGTVESYDGRETAPATATPARFLDAAGKPRPFGEVIGTGLSVGVPSNIALAALAHREHGKLPWARLFGPAIKLARDGFTVNERFHRSLQDSRAGATAEGRALYYANGQPKPVGARIVNEPLARSLAAIAAKGPDSFHRGAFAQGLADTVAAATPNDGRMSAADLAGYEAKERPPVCGIYRAYRICGMGPPSSGGIAVLQILGQLERFDLAKLGPRSLEFWQLFLESQRLAYADRELYLGDSDFVPVPVTGLIDPAYIAERSRLIDPNRVAASVVPGKPAGAPLTLADGDEPEEHGTSHFVAIDGAGTMVSYTSTIESGFGSGLMYGGFYLNNELTDFSFAPEVEGRAVANRVEGGKRPRSSMAPTVIYDPEGRPVIAIGAAGGATIPIQTARSIIGIIDFKLPVREALGLPLAFVFGDTLVVEQGSWLAGEIERLRQRGYTKARVALPPFRAVGAERVEGRWIAAHDPRLDGQLVPPD